MAEDRDHFIADMVHELERAAAVANWRRPDSVVDERPGWFQITTPSSKGRWHNRVVESVMTREEAPRRISEVIAHYRALGVDFAWRVGPSAAPSDLGEILANHGMVPTELVGMAAQVSRVSVSIEPRITVERVGLHNVVDYVHASAAGWNNDPATAASLLADMQRTLADPDNDCQFFVAYCDGEPAGSGALWPVSARSEYFLGSSVAPKFRGLGVYRALVAARITEMRSRGVPLATIWAMQDTSAPICQRLGFEALCKARIYAWPSALA
ncbi:acetyltransferase, GNAT family [Labilithrix luteola]|uniref:Acetyltransferase, GNAT family n=1 Tax=Labilithrix luteola TaxID=1391654 RepID=A0A0K1PQP7_9BACT|nr:GNAT family N-acetyltransferase [Labilithrix luteola]AKU95848.1 acetyltransferase, GNAT family [Labilithrix luteola]